MWSSSTANMLLTALDAGDHHHGDRHDRCYDMAATDRLKLLTCPLTCMGVVLSADTGHILSSFGNTSHLLRCLLIGNIVG
jgi:hypothetical protein